jgi:predicted ATPase
MIKSITLENFKIFEQQTKFPFEKINLLTGINGKGKSSLIQSILIFKQSIDRRTNSNKIFLNGELTNIGNFTDLRNDEVSVSQPVQIDFELLTNFKNQDLTVEINYLLFSSADEMISEIQEIFITTKNTFAFLVDRNAADAIHLKANSSLIAYKNNAIVSERKIGSLDSYLTNFFPSHYFVRTERIQDEFIYLTEFLDFSRIHYISSERLGPRNYYEKKNLPDFLSVGAHGEYTANVLSSFGNEIVVPDSLYIGQSAKTLLSQCQEWMSYLFDGAIIEVQGRDSDYATLALLMNTKSTKSRFKPTNIGFGYSYSLPIIVSGLIAQKGDILIVENPEAHLHPRAQSRIIKFLCRVAQLGVQVIIESHSEHVLNALRIESVSERGITADNISILFFHDKQGGYFDKIVLREDGKIENWVAGFFDQNDEDYKKLIGF